jgi:MFS family permease|tara:strand:+ start:658 stop:1761 length:1104 start_codon:yes stop_codon:yes gene_type:complete
MLGFGIISPLLPVYATNIGATGLWLGIIFAGFSVSRTFSMSIIGRLSDKQSKKRIIVFGLLLYTVISVLYIFASDVYFLTLVRMFHGLASVMVVPIAMAIVGEISVEGEEGIQMSTISTSRVLGRGFGPLIGGAIYAAFGMSSVFLVMSGLSVVAFVMVLLFIPDTKDLGVQKNTLSYRQVLKSVRIRGLFLYRFARAINLGVFFVFLPLFATVIGLSVFEIGVLISSILVLTALLQRPFGYLADRFDRLNLIIFGFIFSAIPLFILPHTSNFVELIFICSFIGVGRALSMPPSLALTIEIGRKIGMGFAMGLLSTAMGIGMITASLTSGFLLDFYGINFPFYFAGIISIITAPIIYLLIKDPNPGI